MDNTEKYRLNPRIKYMECLRCGKKYPVADYFYGCPDCKEQGESSGLRLVYEGKAEIASGKKGMDRYHQFLPYDHHVSLGEGNTPVLILKKMAEEIGVRAVYTKNEFQNPTGSHKDRMNPYIIGRALEMGYQKVTCASSGNEAASLAAYAAAAEIPCVNVSTKKITRCWRNASNASAAQLVLTNTPAERLTYQREHLDGTWYCATNLMDCPSGSSAFGIQGYKTIAFELFEEFGSDLPDDIFVPTCRGDLLYGIFEGFRDLTEQKMIASMPRLVACEPIPRLEMILEQGWDYKEKFPGDTSSMASIGGATAAWQSVYALRESNGFAVSVQGEDIREAVRSMGKYGLFLESSSASVWFCLKNALRSGKISHEDSVLLILTSSGYKDERELTLQ